MIKDNNNKFVAVKIDEQYFGIPVGNVIDILMPQKIYPIPLVSKQIIGSMNLRGRIVTVLDLRFILETNTETNQTNGRCIVIQYKNELFSFLVDEVKSVHDFKKDELMKIPDTLSKTWQDVSYGIFLIDEELTIILDINRIIESIVK